MGGIGVNQVEITSAIEIIRRELLLRGDLYMGFTASIESALKEAKPYTKEHDLAVAILERIIGEEASAC